MKKMLLIIMLYLFKWHLKIIYVFIKLFTKQKSEVFFLSRQGDTMSLNYSMLCSCFDTEGIKYKMICKKVPSGINGVFRNEKAYSSIFNEIGKIFGYYFNMFKQMVYIASSKVIIVDGYNITVSVLNHKKNTKVIQLWHALGAVKKFGYQCTNKEDGVNSKIASILCMHRNYDYVISASDETSKHFSKAFNVPLDKVIVIGTPTVDYLLTEDKIKNKEIYKEYPAMKKKINILYAPTFRSDGSDNTSEVIKYLDKNKYNLIISYHFKSKSKLDDNVIVFDKSKFSTLDMIKVCDYVITDYSAVAMEASVVKTKLLFYVYDYEKYKKENGINIELLRDYKGITFKDIKDVYDVIDKNKYDNETYLKFVNKYISVDGGCAKKLTNLVRELL